MPDDNLDTARRVRTDLDQAQRRLRGLNAGLRQIGAMLAAIGSVRGIAAAARRAGGVQGARRRRGVTVASYSPRPVRRSLILTSGGESPSSSSLDRPGQKATQRMAAGTKASTQAMNATEPLSTDTATYKRTSRNDPHVTSTKAPRRKLIRGMPSKG